MEKQKSAPLRKADRTHPHVVRGSGQLRDREWLVFWVFAAEGANYVVPVLFLFFAKMAEWLLRQFGRLVPF